MKLISVSQLPEKTELVLGVAGGNFGDSWAADGESIASKIEPLVQSYNQTHPNSHITIREYESSRIANFQLELLNGEGPDILLDREALFDMDALVAKGAVEDLAGYLTNAKELSEEDILPGILDLITKDGKISHIPLNFGVDVIIIPKDTSQQVMTPEELVALMAQDEETYVDYWVNASWFLLHLLSGAEIDQYINEENAGCSFESGEFAALLEMLVVLNERESIGKREERAEFFRSGRLPVIIQELNCMEDYFCIRGNQQCVGA